MITLLDRRWIGEEVPIGPCWLCSVLVQGVGEIVWNLNPSVGATDANALAYLQSIESNIIGVAKEIYYEEHDRILVAPDCMLEGVSLKALHFLSNGLPKSTHIASLTGVDIASKTATVTRKFMGELYAIPSCEPTDYMIEEYKAGRLNIGDKVMVEFVEEYPQDELVIIPVIFAKRS